MIWSLLGLVLQLGLKLLPILSQLKIIRDEAVLKEMQRRFEAGLRKCDENALDSARVRKKHKENQDALDKEWEKKWGTPTTGPLQAGPTSFVQPTEPDLIPPEIPAEMTMTVEPNKVKAREVFRIKLMNIPSDAKVELFADKRFRLLDPGSRTDIPLSLIDTGHRTIDAKINEQWVLSCNIVVSGDN